MQGLLWDDFPEAGQWRTGERLVTQEDIERFSELSGDINPLHLDDEYARAAGFERRIAQGVLGTSIATGLVNRLGLTAGTLAALLGMSWRFERPLYPGTRVHVDLTVNALRATRRTDRGIVVLGAVLADEAGSIYQRGELTLLVRRSAVQS
ncbi:MAG TPA: MaoC/PaaZ C-terminal domain-containing protein [Longimicrobiales bacterium]|nr:MaoC/PaaZ C-terminal domain-containing protein [Longimicrobiales bacterium]